VTGTLTSTFTRTNARHIASKIAADLRQMNTFYGYPYLSDIEDYVDEVTELLAAGYLFSFEDGFKKTDSKRVVSVRYVIRGDGTLADDNAGGVRSGADISEADHFNFVKYTTKFNSLPPDERQGFKDALPVTRSPGEEPTDGNGYWESGRSYASGGVGAERGMFRPV
jgi:hypothetical protein